MGKLFLLEELPEKVQSASIGKDFWSKGFMGCSHHLLQGVVHKSAEKSSGLQMLSGKIGKAQSKLCPGKNHANSHSARLNVLGSY